MPTRPSWKTWKTNSPTTTRIESQSLQPPASSCSSSFGLQLAAPLIVFASQTARRVHSAALSERLCRLSRSLALFPRIVFIFSFFFLFDFFFLPPPSPICPKLLDLNQKPPPEYHASIRVDLFFGIRGIWRVFTVSCCMQLPWYKCNLIGLNIL